MHTHSTILAQLPTTTTPNERKTKLWATKPDVYNTLTYVRTYTHTLKIIFLYLNMSASLFF